MVHLITNCAELFWMQMLHHLGFKAFVGGNIGTPLSEAAILCLKTSSIEDAFQVASPLFFIGGSYSFLLQ